MCQNVFGQNFHGEKCAFGSTKEEISLRLNYKNFLPFIGKKSL